MRYAGEQPIEIRAQSLVAGVPLIVPIAKGLSLIQRGVMLDKMSGKASPLGAHANDGTLDAAINRGELGLEREAAMRMDNRPQGMPTVGNALGLF